MLKVIIEMDEEKILSEKKYSLEKVYRAIDRIFADAELVKGENGEYLEKGTPHDFAHFWRVILYLEDQGWFFDNVKTWLWCNSDDVDDPEDFSVEDLVTAVRQKHNRRNMTHGNANSKTC